ncbi:MAG: hypothetical protein ABSH12_04245 [Endomicrobiales bacterium]
MENQKTVRELLKDWLETVMADKVMFNTIINDTLLETIGMRENSMEKTLNILRTAAKEMQGKQLSTGTITKVLIEKTKGLWKIIVFKQPKHPAQL